LNNLNKYTLLYLNMNGGKGGQRFGVRKKGSGFMSDDSGKGGKNKIITTGRKGIFSITITETL